MNKILLILMCLMLISVSGATITHVGEVHSGGSPNYLSNPWSSFILGDYGYVASAYNDSFNIFNISDKTNPTFVSRIYGDTAPNYMGCPQMIHIVGDYAYVTTSNDDSLTILDISDKSNPTYISHINGTGAPNYLNGAFGIDVVGNYAYVCSSEDDSVVIIDISDPNNPSLSGEIHGAGAPNYLNTLYDIEISGNYAYVTALNDDSLTVINITNKSNPTFTGHINGSGSPNYLNGASSLCIDGSVVYVVSCADHSLSSFDISNKTNPILMDTLIGVGSPNYINTPYGIDIKNDIVFITSRGTDDSLVAIDVSIPSNMRFIERISGAGSPNYLGDPNTVTVIGDYAYVSVDDDHALTIFDISGVSIIAEPTFDFSGYSDGDQIFKVDITYANMDYQTPSIGESETSYLYPYNTSTLYAFYPDGTEKWSRNIGAGENAANPFVGVDEIIYVMNDVVSEYRVWAIYPNSTTKYTYDLPAGGEGAITVGSDSHVYACDQDTIYCLDENGNLLWTSTPSFSGQFFFPASLSDANNILFVSGWGGGIAALNTSNGNVVWWHNDTENVKYEDILFPPALSLDESTAYYNSGDGLDCTLFAFNAVTGVLEWEYNTGFSSQAYQSPTVLSDNAIVFGSTGAGSVDNLYCVESTGTLRWNKTFADGWVLSSSVVELGDGSLVILHYGDLFSIDAATGTMSKIFNTVGEDNDYASVSVASNGNLYFVVNGDSFYGVKGSVAAEYDYADYVSGLVPNNFHIWRNQPNSLVPTLSNVRILSTTTNSITIAWDLDAITDNVKVYRDTNTNLIGQSTGTLYTDTNLASGTRYNYWLQPWSGAIVGAKYAISGSTGSTGGGVPIPTPTITPRPTTPSDDDSDQYQGWGNFSITVPDFWKSPLWLIILFMLVTLMIVGYATEERK